MAMVSITKVSVGVRKPYMRILRHLAAQSQSRLRTYVEEIVECWIEEHRPPVVRMVRHREPCRMRRSAEECAE